MSRIITKQRWALRWVDGYPLLIKYHVLELDGHLVNLTGKSISKILQKPLNNLKLSLKDILVGELIQHKLKMSSIFMNLPIKQDVKHMKQMKSGMNMYGYVIEF